GQVVRAGPVGVPGGAALVDPLRQRAHGGDAGADLLAEQYAAAARLGALADDDLNGVGLAQVVGVEAVARRQALVDERLAGEAFLGRHATVAGGGRGAHRRRGPADRLLGIGRQRPEAHAGDGDWDGQLDRLLGVAGAEDRLGVALLTVAFERVAGGGGGEK